MIRLIELVRRNWLFFLLVTMAGLALRLFFGRPAGLPDFPC